MKPTLTEDDHRNLSLLLARVLKAHAAGELSADDATTGLAHLIAAIDIRNRTEIDSWVRQDGICFFKRLASI